MNRSRWTTWATLGMLIASLSGALAQSGEQDPIAQQEDVMHCAVHNMAMALGSALELVPDEATRIELVRRLIHPFRFFPDESGYFFVYTVDGVNVAHGTQPELEGKDLSGQQDSQGKYVIRELADTARRGGGLVDYYWRKPKGQRESRKVGYVEMIPGTAWFIGSGLYLPE